MDDREEQHRLASPHPGLSLFLRRLAPASGGGRSVLYVHGATFPSALSVAHRFANGSWRDALVQAGFDVWALDFLGFGGSDPYPAMARPAEDAGPLLLAADAATQLEAAVRCIADRTGGSRVSLIAHSWGTAVAGLLAGHHPDLVDRLVLFGPISRRDPPRYLPRPDAPAWRVVTVQAQWDRFVDAYNHGRRLKTLRGLTPYEFVCKTWTEQPTRFKTDPSQHTLGPNILGCSNGPQEAVNLDAKMLGLT